MLISMTDEQVNVSCLVSAGCMIRDLRKMLKDGIRKAGEPLSLEEADVLVDLMLWRDGTYYPQARKEAYAGNADTEWMPMSALKENLVHGDSLLSKRLKALAGEGFLEMRKVTEFEEPERSTFSRRMHGNSSLARITPEGEAVATRIWERYCRLADRLLAPAELERAGLGQENLEPFIQLNRFLQRSLQTLGHAWPD